MNTDTIRACKHPDVVPHPLPAELPVRHGNEMRWTPTSRMQDPPTLGRCMTCGLVGEVGEIAPYEPSAVSSSQEEAETPQIEREGPQKQHQWPYSALTPTQQAIYSYLVGRPLDGACRRDFAGIDVYEVANRITEIERRLGIVVERERCRIHRHRRPFVRYRL